MFPATITDANGIERIGNEISIDLEGGAWVTVVHAPPTTFVTPLMFDDTADTGGLYAWNGAAYVQVGAALS